MSNKQALSALKKVDNWYKTMVYLCVIFALITFVLWVVTRGSFYTNDAYIHAIARFWASLALTIFFGAIAVTVKRIHKALLELAGEE